MELNTRRHLGLQDRNDLAIMLLVGRYGGEERSYGRRPRSPSPGYYRDTRPRRDYRSRSRSYERPRY